MTATGLPTTQVPTLIVGDWSSYCSVCRAGSDLETSHNTLLPLLPQRDGRRRPCGVEYAAVALAADANGLGQGGAEQIAAELGLPFVGRRADDRQRGSVAGRVAFDVLGLVVFIGLALWLCGNWSAL